LAPWPKSKSNLACCWSSTAAFCRLHLTA